MDKWDYILKLDRPPTIDEMDGLLTPEDLANKYRVMVQCANCNTFNEQSIDRDKVSKEYLPCYECGSSHYDTKTTISWRTYPPNRNRIESNRKAVW